jgi:tetratricopeptide (TPR) repeat protein
MSSPRLTQLQEFYDEDPHDPFNIYALALEYLKSDTQKSKELFLILMNDHSSYIPVYYHAGKLWEQLGDVEGALRIYEKGMEWARKLNDQKALRELRSSYEELKWE